MINENKPVLIIEHSNNKLTVNEKANTGKKSYLLEGVFTEFDVMNRNERIYTKDDFLPHLNDLIERKNELGVIFGEFDHPTAFDTSLTRASHVIENIWYNNERNLVEGQIKLLSNSVGREARAIVDDGYPIFVSSRAAGVTESNGRVKLKKLFTYDAVADPGFGSAKMQVRCLNESLGFNDKTNFRIYDLSDDTKINELYMDNKQDEKVTTTQFNEYSEYIKTELSKIKAMIIDEAKTGKNPEQMQKLLEMQENYMLQYEKLTKYLNYLSETIQHVVNTNIKLEEKVNLIEQHSDYLAENIEKTINYSNYLAENLDKNINYSEYIAETLDKNIDFSEYIAEHVDNNIKYSEYIAENLDKNIAYSEYIAENLDKGIEYSEYLAETLDKGIAYSEYLAESLDKDIAYSEYIAEHVDNNIKYSEYIAENLSDNQAYTNYLAETVDNTIEVIKNNKINENVDAQIPNMKDVQDVSKYWDEDEDDEKIDAQIPDGEEVQTPEITSIETQTQEDEIQTQTQDDETETQDDETQKDEIQSQEGEPISDIIPGATVTFDDDKTGEVMAYNPNNGMVVIQMSDVEDTIELHESKINILNVDNVTVDSFKKSVSELITETKKRKASEDKEPEFLNFLTESNKKAWYNLSDVDKEKAVAAINESGQIYTESQVLNIINESLSVKKTQEEILLENMPKTLSNIWEQIDEKYKVSIFNQAKLYTSLNTPLKMEKFWESRNLEQYLKLNETKKVLNENKKFDNSSLSEQEMEAFISRLRNL